MRGSKNGYFVIIIVLVFTLSMISCEMLGLSSPSSGSSGDGKISFSGSISDVTSRSLTSTSGIHTKATTGELEIVVIYDPQESWLLKEIQYKTFQVNDDGTFTFEIEKGKKFIAFLVDPTKDFQKCLGVIGISNGITDYWENIDTTQLDGDVTLGKISQSSEDMLLESENDINSFGSSIENQELVDYMASVDDSLRILENFINTGFEVATFPNYQIHNTERSENVITQWGTGYLTNYEYHGYQFFINSLKTDYGMDVELEVPYEVVTIGGTSYQDGEKITSVFDATQNMDAYGDLEVDWKCAYNIPDGGDNLLTSVPTQGDWVFYDDSGNEKVGEFNYSLAYPVDKDNTSIFTTIVPRLKVNIEDGTDEKIESLQVRWYEYDKTTGEYNRVETSVLNQTYDHWVVSITDFSKETRVDELITDIEDFSDKKIPVSKDWYLYDRNKVNHATGIYISLFTNGYTAFYANRENNN